MTTELIEDQVQRVELTVQPDLTADATARTIAGLVLPYNVLGERTSAGPVIFTAGAVEHHPDLRRVKLLVDHDPSRSVGYCTQLTQTEDGVHAVFHVPAGPDGDEALAKAGNGVRDGFSVGTDLTGHHLAADKSHTIVTRARLNEVSLVSLPAFTDSRVLTVRAAQQQGATMPESITPELPGAQPVQPSAPAQTPPASPSTPPAPPAVQPEQTEDERLRERGIIPVQFSQPPAPFAGAGGHVTPPAGDSLHQAARLIAGVVSSGGGASEVRAALGRVNPRLTAALSDVVPGDDAGHGFIGRPNFLGELWEARRTGRPVMEGFGAVQTLTKIKDTGWRWVTRPQVGDYAGNKAEIPSNEVETAPVEVTAERVAGGWDVDRIYVDLGDADMIAALFTAAMEDYQAKSEAKAVAKLLAAATPVTGPFTDLPTVLVQLGVRAATIGATIGVLSFATDVWAQFLTIKRADLPWWINADASVSINEGSVTIGGLSLSANPSLTAGTVLAADKRAATFKESKTRVQALDVAHGGVDLGVFAYMSALIHDSRAVFKTTVAQG